MELWPLRLFSSRLSSACPGTQRGRMAKVGRNTARRCIGGDWLSEGATVVRPWAIKLADVRLTWVQQHVAGQQVLLSTDPSCVMLCSVVAQRASSGGIPIGSNGGFPKLVLVNCFYYHSHGCVCVLR